MQNDILGFQGIETEAHDYEILEPEQKSVEVRIILYLQRGYTQPTNLLVSVTKRSS
jgi:hypothetical protein